MFDRTRIIQCSEARQLVAEGAQLVDVRSPQEFAKGALPGAMNIPLQTLGVDACRLDAGQTVIVYCASGMRSKQAADVLNAQGLSSVHDMGSWQNLLNCH